MIPAKKPSFQPFLVELAVYAVFVSVYFLGFLHFLGGWLGNLFEQERNLYAVVTIVLIIVQAVGLEFLASWILRVVRQRME